MFCQTVSAGCSKLHTIPTNQQMLRAALCFRPKPTFLYPTRLSLTLPSSPFRLLSTASIPRASTCLSRWPSGCEPVRRRITHGGPSGEGSWNVAWDARPARWIHRVDSTRLWFGVCAWLGIPVRGAGVAPRKSVTAVRNDSEGVVVFESEKGIVKYRVRGVKADGRCLFRALAHLACIKNGEAAPDENHERELADDLRAQVVDELKRRRRETELFIDEDFDVYVDRMKQPYVWGGEPELMVASHVLKKPISVFKINKGSEVSLMKIADYGEEYLKENEDPITIQFHGYGHYDILEMV